jgi:hypothetical protein
MSEDDMRRIEADPATASARVMHGHIAVSPRGRMIPSTLRQTADAAWQALREAITEPDSLAENGWKIGRVVCTLVEVLPDEQ